MHYEKCPAPEDRSWMWQPLPGAANQFAGGSCTVAPLSPASFHGALLRQQRTSSFIWYYQASSILDSCPSSSEEKSSRTICSASGQPRPVLLWEATGKDGCHEGESGERPQVSCCQHTRSGRSSLDGTIDRLIVGLAVPSGPATVGDHGQGDRSESSTTKNANLNTFDPTLRSDRLALSEGAVQGNGKEHLQDGDSGIEDAT
jgi:hypothetical protein